MRASVVPFPVGGWQGTPALRCVIDDPSALGPQLIDQMRANSCAGARLAWIVTDLWGHEAWDQFLVQLMGDRMFGEMPVVTIRESAQAEWSNIGIDWIVDISRTFGRPMNADTLRETAVIASAVPVPAELIWFDAPPENVTVDAMEIIHDCFTPTVGSWLYTEDRALADQGFRCASRAAATWGVRAHSEGIWTEI